MTSCDTNVINIKLGSDVILNCIYQDADNNPLSLSGILIFTDFISPKTGEVLFEASMATPGGNIAGIIVTNESLGEYTINAGSSAGWPLGEMPLDILYSKSGILQHTDDFILDFQKGRTQLRTENTPDA